MRVGPFGAATGIEKIRGMNKTEANYATHLETLTALGDVLWHAFEPIKLKLAKGSYYKPDFLVMMKDGTLEVHEVKGFWREAARVRIKVAASMYPFRFIAVTVGRRGAWEMEMFE